MLVKEPPRSSDFMRQWLNAVGRLRHDIDRKAKQQFPTGPQVERYLHIVGATSNNGVKRSSRSWPRSRPRWVAGPMS